MVTKSQILAAKNPWSPATTIGDQSTSGAPPIVSELILWVPSVPVAQPRQRHAMIAGHVRNFTPTKHPVNAFKAACQKTADDAYRGAPWVGPVQMHIVFVFSRPAALVWKKREMLRVRHFKKPDGDNLWKSIADALNGRVFVDDSQLCLVTVEKWIASGDEQPHVEVLLRKI